MKARLAIAMLLVCSAAHAFTVNEQGTAGAPKSVSNSAVRVLAGKPQRKAWCGYSETVAVRCMWGGTDDTAPTITPTTTVGFYMNAGQLYCANAGPNSNVPASNDPQQRMDCISTGAATNFDTVATP